MASIDQWLRLSGVPFRHLKKFEPRYQFSVIDFVSSSGGRVIVTPEDQSQCYQQLKLRMSSLGDSALYGIGSYPTEVASYQFAVEICRAYTEYCFANRQIARIKWIDLAAPDWSYLKSSDENDIIVVHGLSDASDPRRLELAKDFVRKSSDCTIMVLATTNNIIDLVIRRLGLHPMAVWQLSTIKTHVVV